MLTETADKKRLCLQASKVVSHISNVVIGLFAILLIAIGSAALNQLQQFGSLYKVSIPAGIIVLGVFMLLIPILGFWGTIKEKKPVLIVYCIILFAFVICEFGVGGGAYSMRAEIPNRLEHEWSLITPEDRDKIETRFECCGWANITDYPGPTCESYIVNGTIAVTTKGCGEQLTATFQDSLYAVGTVAIVFATFELAGLVFAVVVFCYLRQEAASASRI